MSKCYTNSYGQNNQENHKAVADVVMEYFNRLGMDLAEAISNKAKISRKAMDTNANIIAMRDIGFSAINLSGEFNYGQESQIADILFGKDQMTYHDYIESIYKLACSTVWGGYKYNQHHSLISKLPTFEDLYNYIQTAPRDSYGYNVIDDGTALHIYGNKYQVNVCKQNIGGYWDPICNVIFYKDEGLCKIYHVVDGISDFNNGLVFPVHKNIVECTEDDKSFVPNYEEVRAILLMALANNF